MNEKIVVRKIARLGMDYAKKKGYGLGECTYYMNEAALNENMDCDAFNWEDSCSDPKHNEHLREARRIGDMAYELACELEDKGIKAFN